MDISWTSTWGRCPVCKKSDFLGRHTCPPSWEVFWVDGDEEDAVTVYADDAEGAACDFASARWDYDTGSWDVKVRKDFESEWQVFTVTVEMVPSFSAEIKQKDG